MSIVDSDPYEKIPARHFYEGEGGWIDGRIGQASALIHCMLAERGYYAKSREITMMLEELDNNFSSVIVQS